MMAKEDRADLLGREARHTLTKEERAALDAERQKRKEKERKKDLIVYLLHYAESQQEKADARAALGPMAKTTLRIPRFLQRECKMAAAMHSLSLQDWLMQTLNYEVAGLRKIIAEEERDAIKLRKEQAEGREIIHPYELELLERSDQKTGKLKRLS